MRKTIAKSLMHLFPKADPMWDFIVLDDEDAAAAKAAEANAEEKLAAMTEENEQLRNHVAELQAEIDTLRPPAPAPVYEVPWFTGGPAPVEAPAAQPVEPTPAEDPVTPVPTPAAFVPEDTTPNE